MGPAPTVSPSCQLGVPALSPKAVAKLSAYHHARPLEACLGQEAGCARDVTCKGQWLSRRPGSLCPSSWPNPLLLPSLALLVVVRDRTHAVCRGPEQRLLMPSTVWPLDGAMIQETRTRGWGGVVVMLLPRHQPSRHLHLRQTGFLSLISTWQPLSGVSPSCFLWALGLSPTSWLTTGSLLFTGWT